MKKQDKKKDRRSSFFDSNGDGEDTSDGSSVNMIYVCDFVPEVFKVGDYDDVENIDDVRWDEELAFVFVTMKMEVAFNACSLGVIPVELNVVQMRAQVCLLLLFYGQKV